MSRCSAQHPAWWTPERRAVAAERSRQRWRERNPEKAAIRDEIVATETERPCRCGSTAVTLFVTDYATRVHVWRCRPCAKGGAA